MDHETGDINKEAVLSECVTIPQQVMEDREGHNSDFYPPQQKIVQDDLSNDDHFPDNISLPAKKPLFVIPPAPRQPLKQGKQGEPHHVHHKQDGEKEETLFEESQEMKTLCTQFENLKIRTQGTVAESINKLRRQDNSFHDLKTPSIKFSIEESLDVNNVSQHPVKSGREALTNVSETMDQETGDIKMETELSECVTIAQQEMNDSVLDRPQPNIFQDDLSNDGHFPDDICFPARKTGFVIPPDPCQPLKQGKQGEPHHVHHKQDVVKEEILFEESQEVETVPPTFENLNIKPRGTVVCATVVESITILSSQDNSFHDLKTPSIKVKVSIEEESVDVYNDSQYIVLGSSQDVSLLLTRFSVFDQQKTGTYGVILDNSMKPSPRGRYDHGKEYQVIKELGRGGFGQVDLCEYRSGKKYVCKKISARFHKKEVEVLNTLSHPNITGFLGYIFREGRHEILMEYAGVSLTAFIAANSNWRELWTPDAVMRMAMQVFSALAYMHTVFEILHLDIKPDNICIAYVGDNSPVVKLTDFGTSKTPEGAISYDVMTHEYVSPEACRRYFAAEMSVSSRCFLDDEVTDKSDVFAFGLTIFYMLQGQHTVQLLWENQLNSCISDSDLAILRRKFISYLAQSPNYIQEYVIQAVLDEKIRQLLRCLLAGDPKVRMTAEEAGLYIQQEVLPQKVLLPNILPPSSTSSSISAASGDLMTSLTFDLTQPLKDISLKKPVPPSGGKDIKNNLRQKLLRRKSTHPYHRHGSRTTSSTGRADPEADKLSNFAALFD